MNQFFKILVVLTLLCLYNFVGFAQKSLNLEATPKTSLSQSEIVTLKKYIYPLRTYEPDGGGTKDLKILNQLIGNSKVVALGENSHGSSEIFKLKNRIIQYLAVNKGFDIFSIEANMPEAYKVNDYTVRGKGDPKKLLDIYFWTVRNEELLNLVEWMHKFNKPKQRIEFTGFDQQKHYGAIDELFNAFKGNEEVENKIADLKKILDEMLIHAQQTNRYDLDDNEIKKIDSIIPFLQNSITTSSFQVSKKDWLRQNIVIIQQLLGMKNVDINVYSAIRDKDMADNVLWIKNQNPKSKLIVWAHNEHIMKTDKRMGNYLSQKLGDDYTTFGFTFFDGSYTANRPSIRGISSYDAVQAYPGTLEYLLEQLKEPIFILDLKKIKVENPKETEWLTGQLLYRRVGAVGGGNEFTERKIIDDFDYLIFIKTSSASVVIPKPQ